MTGIVNDVVGKGIAGADEGEIDDEGIKEVVTEANTDVDVDSVDEVGLLYGKGLELEVDVDVDVDVDMGGDKEEFFGTGKAFLFGSKSSNVAQELFV